MLSAAVTHTYALTPVQEGMAFHQLQATNVGVDVEQFVGHLAEQLEPDRFETAWRLVADRHDVLRTRFRWGEPGGFRQEILESVTPEITTVDLRSSPSDTQRQDVEALLTKDRRRGFDMEEAPLWRVMVVQLGEAEDCVVFSYHHALLDTSVVWCVQEVFEAYDAAGRGEPPPFESRRPFRDHIRWLEEHLPANRAAADAYFQELLHGVEHRTPLTALERSDGAAEEGYGADRFGIAPALSEALHRVGKELRVGVPAIVETAWALVLAAFSGSSDVVFGSTRGCRRSGLPGSDRIMGLLINTVPVRLRVDRSLPVRDLLQATRARQVGMRPHEHTPLAQVAGAVGRQGADLFDTIVVVNDLHQGTRLKQAGPAFATRDFDLHDQTNFAVTLLAYLDPDVHFKLSYDRRRFDGAGMGRVRELFLEILEAMVMDADRPVSSLPAVPARDRDQMAAWNDTARPYPTEACIHTLFEAQADRTPEAIALVFRAESLTFRDLDRRANGVASQLRRVGVGVGSLVGVFVERSVEMVVGILGVLKAGAAYVPLDPLYPPARIAKMVEDANLAAVLVQERLRASLPPGEGPVIALDDVWLPSGGTSRVASAVASSDLAYVIFTSGSTGRPKGVMIEHRNVVNLLTAMDDALTLDPSKAPGVWLAVTSISFDISVLEMFWTMTRGLTLVVQEDDRALARRTDERTEVVATRPIEFSLFYFAADASGERSDRYRLLLDGARFADEHGFAAVWTPERHFHPFGGNYPNAALTSAAVAMVTSRIAIRAGSVVLPLHNPIRCAEDWSVVDNLSGGRVGLSFASGWHANDFALAPGNFDDRRRLMADGIETIRALWRGDAVAARSGDGGEISVHLYPRPVQTEPPIWITAGGSESTFVLAGRLGASILTNLLVMSRDELARNIDAYRAARRAAGHPGNGHVSLMLHTFVDPDPARVQSIVRQPFLDYLTTSTDLINQVRWEQTSFAKPNSSDGARAPGLSGTAAPTDLGTLSDEDRAAVMNHAFERYVHTAGLFGSPDSCMDTVRGLQALGVDEIACLVDFGLDDETVLAGLRSLDVLRARFADDRHAPGDPGGSNAPAEAFDLPSQIRRHGVTHLQCTPSLAQVVAATPEGLAALGRLELLLLGGEALPVALVERIIPALTGDLLNMYGPTETTVWSTMATVDGNRPLTIGRPIANTHVHIVGDLDQPLPIGVPGELLIGGAGVVRGYLDRPELTAERFVELPGIEGRHYRTGDLVRFVANGEIEFGGRIDHQVKIRGHRIELGEIETAIGRNPRVVENVVVASADQSGAARLVAYVVATAEADDAEGSKVAEWAQLWDATYRASNAHDATFDIAGWNSSYTGRPLPVEDLREWLDATVSRIERLAPQNVLEIGCGTGMILFRVAPGCARYVALDAAPAALERIAAQLGRTPLPGVELISGSAREVSDLVQGDFDTIILNSVAQYFTGADELVDVVEQALSLLRPGGSLVLGDLRSLASGPLFAAAVELERAPSDLSVDEFRRRVEQRLARDEEMSIDPGLFGVLAARQPEIGRVRVQLKKGRADNELTKFRYDVTLSRSDGNADTSMPVVSFPSDRFDTADLPDALHAAQSSVRITGFRNARLVREAELARCLDAPAGPATVADLRSHVATVDEGVHPDDVLAWLAHAGWTDVDATWSDAGLDRFDVIVRSNTSTGAAASPSAGEFGNARPTSATRDDGKELASFTNTPARRSGRELIAELRSALRVDLPDFMVPGSFVLLDALPRTPNGKVDRAALPAPERSSQEPLATAVSPAGELERAIADIWGDLLSMDVVSVDTNVFELGANSLMTVNASMRIAAALEMPVSVVDMFRNPTVRSLASYLSRNSAPRVGDEPNESDNRAHARREAMLRQRGARRR